jgi:hypothetical protein
MKNLLLICTVGGLLALVVTPSYYARPECPAKPIINQTTDTVEKKMHPVIENIFYHLPLEKSRRDLCAAIANDQRFILKDTAVDHQPTASFFTGSTIDKGVMTAAPDSIQVLVFSGNTTLTTEKDGAPAFKNIMLLNLKYFYSTKDTVETEYKRVLKMLSPILKDVQSEKMNSAYTNGKVKGQMTVVSEIFHHYHPYYRVGVSVITKVPSDKSQPVFTLDLVVSQEDH